MENRARYRLPYAEGNALMFQQGKRIRWGQVLEMWCHFLSPHILIAESLFLFLLFDQILVPKLYFTVLRTLQLMRRRCGYLATSYAMVSLNEWDLEVLQAITASLGYDFSLSIAMFASWSLCQ